MRVGCLLCGGWVFVREWGVCGWGVCVLERGFVSEEGFLCKMECLCALG